MRRLTALTVCLIAAAWLAACRGAAPARDIVFIVVDTLRPDRLGAYGSTRGLTPFIDSRAARGYVFGRAYAQSSWTNPSVASMFTSRYQSQHHVISFGSTLAEEELTLAEVLKPHGYATGAFLANILVQPKLGFAQGFDRFKNSVRPRETPKGAPGFLKARAEAINREAFVWLDGLGAQRPPVFLYLHYMEPHAPYDPPEAMVARVLDGRPRQDLDAVNNLMYLPQPDADAALVQGARDFYDAEVMSLDAELRNLFAGLEQRGVLRDAVVVFTADHGEEFEEHGLMGHHQTLFEEVIHVPLLLLVPQHTARTDIHDMVELIDVAPTLLDLAGVPRPAPYEGRSLAAAYGAGHESWWARPWWRLTHRASATPPAISELLKAKETLRLSPHERAVVLDTHKLIAGVDGEREYYDLAADPHEKNPNGLDDAARAGASEAITAFVARAAQRAVPARAHEIDAETKERMRNLGYAE